MDFDTEDLWVTKPLDRQQPLHRNLRTLDAAMRCEICGDLFQNPVSLVKCQHTFCSECIRNSLTEQMKRVRQGGPTCPSCRVELDGRNHAKNFQPNRLLANIVAAFGAVRQPLHQVLATTATTTSCCCCCCDGKPLPSETTAVKDTSHEHDTRRGTKRVAASTTEPVQLRLEPKRRRIYSMLKKKQLQEICHQEGISTLGSEQQLKERHQRFIVFWNAHMDTAEGMSDKTPPQIVQAFNNNERERQSLIDQRNRDKGALEQVYKRAVGGTAHGGGGTKSAFERKMDNDFRKLIAQCRNQQTTKTQPKSPSHTSAFSMDSNAADNALEEPRAESAAQVGPVQDDTPLKQEACAKTSAVSPELTNETMDTEKIQPNVSLPRNSAREDSDQVMVVDDEAEEESKTKTSQPTNVHSKEAMATAQSGRRRRGRTLTGPWACPACTFYNKTRTWSAAKCEICDTLRPKPCKNRN